MFSAYTGTQQGSQQPPQGAPRLQPNENEAVSILQHLNKEELKQLLESESKLDDLIYDLQQVKTLGVDKEMLIASNKSLAEYNISQQPRFTELKNRLGTVYEEVNQLKTVLAKDIAKLDGDGDRQSLDTILAVLQTAAAEAEENSEILADDLFNKKVEVDSFVPDYIQIRKTAHTRKVQAEKMSELLQNGLRHEVTPLSNYNWNSNASSSPGHVPYPTGPAAAPYPTAAPYPMGASFRMPEPPYR
ncbi:hypothetical protein ScPMuIL_006660 [Solemya velum]